MSDEAEFFRGAEIEDGLKAAEVPIGAKKLPDQRLVPDADRPRARPAMVVQEDGSATIYLEIVVPPPYVDLMMRSKPGLVANCRVLAHDAAQVLYNFILRTRDEYLKGRKQR